MALYFQTFADYPVVVAANRDEYLSRPATPPCALQNVPWIFGGKDLRAGGTWLGVNQYGLVAGLLNRHTAEANDPKRRSRGLLTLDALRSSSARQAAAAVRRQPADRYNPFNLLIADAREAYVLFPRDGALHTQALGSGVHLLTNMNPNDPECPRIAHSFRLFEAVVDKLGDGWQAAGEVTELFRLLHERLSDHATPLDPRADDPRNGLCIHLDGYGTRSSSLLAYSMHQRRFIYHFTPGAPCRTNYSEVCLPPAPLASQPPSTT